MTRCLLVDDDAEIRRTLVQYLAGFGIDCDGAADGTQMRRAMQGSSRYDVLVLDLMLPGEDGLTLLRWVRQTASTPVIMLTARGDPASRVVGLEMGADDYVAKPFDPRELVARIQAVERRGSGRTRADTRTVSFAGWRFDRMARQLLGPDDVAMPLSSAEHRLLCAFVEHAGQVLGRDRLLDLTRAAGTEVSDRSIDLAVSRLRVKLGDSPKEPRLIRTIRGEGYLFDTDVKR